MGSISLTTVFSAPFYRYVVRPVSICLSFYISINIYWNRQILKRSWLCFFILLTNRDEPEQLMPDQQLFFMDTSGICVFDLQKLFHIYLTCCVGNWSGHESHSIKKLKKQVCWFCVITKLCPIIIIYHMFTLQMGIASSVSQLSDRSYAAFEPQNSRRHLRRKHSELQLEQELQHSEALAAEAQNFALQNKVHAVYMTRCTMINIHIENSWMFSERKETETTRSYRQQ